MNRTVEKIKQNNRLEYVDIAKGIVIFLCVLGHLVTYGRIPFRLIFAFHMPFFFIISGWCRAAKKTQKPFGIQLKNNAIKLLGMSLVSRCITGIGAADATTFIKHVFLDPYAEWFLPTMFAANILFYFFEKFEQKYIADNIPAKVFSLATITGCTMLFVKFYNEHGFHMRVGCPFSFDCVLLAFTFVVSGYYIRQFYEKHPIDIKIQSPAFVCLWTMILFSGALVVFNEYVNICDAELGKSEVFTIFIAVLYSMVTIWLSNKLSEAETKNVFAQKLSKLLQLWGRYSI